MEKPLSPSQVFWAHWRIWHSTWSRAFWGLGKFWSTKIFYCFIFPVPPALISHNISEKLSPQNFIWYSRFLFLIMKKCFQNWKWKPKSELYWKNGGFLNYLLFCKTRFSIRKCGLSLCVYILVGILCYYSYVERETFNFFILKLLIIRRFDFLGLQFVGGHDWSREMISCWALDLHHICSWSCLVVKEQTNNSYKEECSKECDPKSERKISTFLFSLFLFYFLLH